MLVGDGVGVPVAEAPGTPLGLPGVGVPVAEALVPAGTQAAEPGGEVRPPTHGTHAPAEDEPATGL